MSYLRTVTDRHSIVTAFDGAVRFPELLNEMLTKYQPDIDKFRELVRVSSSSADLLDRIRSRSIHADTRISLLKMFRRCVSPVVDTEASKKITSISTASLVANYGATFKPIETLKRQFEEISDDRKAALAVLIGEYDTRGKLGYHLTDEFFRWFQTTFGGSMTIEGPRGAGRDIELSTLFPAYQGSCPCDFAIRRASDHKVLAIGFARYDSTRGGAQSDDRTGGNANKVDKVNAFCALSGNRFRVIFISDGPGLTHGDTWEEACTLDGHSGDNVRVATLKLANVRITPHWLLGA